MINVFICRVNKSILTELRGKKQYFLDQIDEMKAELRPRPTEEQIKRSAQLMSAIIKHGLMSDDDETVKHYKAAQTDKKRQLTDLVFSGTNHKGMRYGVYIYDKDNESFKVQIQGHYYTPGGGHINVKAYKYQNKHKHEN